MNAKVIPGFKTLLIGPSGTGKTYSLRTLAKTGLQTFVLFTESGAETVGDVPAEQLHWHYIPPTTASWDTLIDSATKINSMPYESLTKLGDISKRQYTEFIQVLQNLSNFEDERTGQAFGAVDSWGPDRVIVIDSLSGLSTMAMNLVVGSKPAKSQPDWGVAQDNLERLIIKLCNLNCHVVIIGHVEREFDEVTGGIKNMVSTLGKKLPPKLPKHFSDVVLAKREGTKFFWSTDDPATDLKTRNLPIQGNISPDFGLIYTKWKQQAGL